MKHFVKNIEKRLARVRRSRPELGRLRLLWIFLVNWPTLIMAFIGSGNKLVRNGYGFPTMLLVLSLGLGSMTGMNETLNSLIYFTALAMVILGTWAVFGVISTVFNTPISEGILYRIERLVCGLPSKVNPENICKKHAELAEIEGRLEDHYFFMESRHKIEKLEKHNQKRLNKLDITIQAFRKELSKSRARLRTECLVRNFTGLFMVFLGTIFAFALLCHIISFYDPAAFDPAGELKSFWASVYFSFTTVTTTDFGDITAKSGWARFITIWEECFGVAFMTAIIGAAVDVFRRSGKSKKYKYWNEKRLRKRIYAFALRLFRDYDELSKPRRDIDDLLDKVEERTKRIGEAKAMKFKRK